MLRATANAMAVEKEGEHASAPLLRFIYGSSGRGSQVGRRPARTLLLNFMIDLQSFIRAHRT